MNDVRNHQDVLHFNPRTREGCDDEAIKQQMAIIEISIHAPVKGAT